MSVKFTEQQSLFITYTKALAIITVVIGHYEWSPFTIYDPYIFHMPLFFIIGGIVMKPIFDIKKWLKDCCSKYIFYIVIWFCTLAAITYFINHNFETNIQLRLIDKGQFNPIQYATRANMHGNSLFMVAWFLITFFISANIFKIKISIITRFITTAQTRLLCLILGLVIGYLSITYIAPTFNLSAYWSHHKKYWFTNFVCQIGVAYMFIAIGYAIQEKLIVFSSFPLLVITILLMVTFVGNDTFHPLGMSWSQYPDGFIVHLSSALLGSFGLMSVAYYLSLSLKSQALSAIGKHSKDIMTLHMLAFVIVDLLMVNLGYFEYGKIMALVHYETPSMWAIYITFALIFPISIRLSLIHLQAFIKKRIRHLPT